MHNQILLLSAIRSSSVPIVVVCSIELLLSFTSRWCPMLLLKFWKCEGSPACRRTFICGLRIQLFYKSMVNQLPHIDPQTVWLTHTTLISLLMTLFALITLQQYTAVIVQMNRKDDSKIKQGRGPPLPWLVLSVQHNPVYVLVVRGSDLFKHVRTWMVWVCVPSHPSLLFINQVCNDGKNIQGLRTCSLHFLTRPSLPVALARSAER